MRRAIERAGRGRGLFAGALAVITVLACEPKLYPDAEPGVMVALEADSELDGTAELTAGAGGMPGSIGAGSTELGSDTAEPRPIADADCTPVPLYRDRDGDTYGGNAEEDRIQGCLPSLGYATRSGDCLDAAPTPENRANFVNPATLDYFGVGYPTPTGESFDYDCNEREDVNPMQATRTKIPDCSLATFPGCNGGAGYLPTERTGLGVSPLCGSGLLVICNPSAEECIAQSQPLTDNPLRCR